MSLNLKNLETHARSLQRKLTDLESDRKKIEKELSSTTFILNQEKARRDSLTEDKTTYKGWTVEAAIRHLFTCGKYEKLGAQQVTTILLGQGIYGSEDSLRANVGLTLKKLWEINNFVDREDISKGKQPLYVYYLRKTLDEAVGEALWDLGNRAMDKKLKPE